MVDLARAKVLGILEVAPHARQRLRNLHTSDSQGTHNTFDPHIRQSLHTHDSECTNKTVKAHKQHSGHTHDSQGTHATIETHIRQSRHTCDSQGTHHIYLYIYICIHIHIYLYICTYTMCICIYIYGRPSRRASPSRGSAKRASSASRAGRPAPMTPFNEQIDDFHFSVSRQNGSTDVEIRRPPRQIRDLRFDCLLRL